MKLTRKEIYRKFLRKKGPYNFWHAINYTTNEQVMCDEIDSRKKLIDWIMREDKVSFRCGWVWNVKRGDNFEEWVREKNFEWDYELNDFVLIECENYRGE